MRFSAKKKPEVHEKERYDFDGYDSTIEKWNIRVPQSS